MIKFSETLEALPGYPLAELPAIKRRLIEEGMDVIDLGAGDVDLPPPGAAVEALRAALATPALSKYGFQQGLPEFRQAIAAWMERRFGQRFDPAAELLPLIGSKEGIAHLPFTVLNPGDVAIVPEPGYQAYLGGTLLAGGTPHVVPLTPRTRFLLELDELPEDVLRRAKLLFLNYPNNPTAAVAPRDYLERTVALCRRYDILLAYDNAYSEIGFDGYRAPGIFEIDGAREIAVEFFSLSKTFSMTGWRVGWAAGRRELIAALARVKSYVDTGVFLALQKAGAIVVAETEQLAGPLVAQLQQRRDAGVAALREAGFAAEQPRAAMYLWVPLPPAVPSAVFARRALEQEGVLVLAGSAFGPGGEGFFRIALTVGAERLAEAARRLGRVRAALGSASVAAGA